MKHTLIERVDAHYGVFVGDSYPGKSRVCKAVEYTILSDEKST
jgi:hypothetical protein